MQAYLKQRGNIKSSIIVLIYLPTTVKHPIIGLNLKLMIQWNLLFIDLVRFIKPCKQTEM